MTDDAHVSDIIFVNVWLEPQSLSWREGVALAKNLKFPLSLSCFHLYYTFIPTDEGAVSAIRPRNDIRREGKSKEIRG